MTKLMLLARDLVRPPSFLVLLALILGGCASQATHLNGDLIAADNLCRQHGYTTKANLVQCYGTNERTVVARDLPGSLNSYDAWQSARSAASKDYDAKVTLAQTKASAALKVAIIDNGKKLNPAVTHGALRDKVASAVHSACKKDRLWRSPSLVTDYTCARNVMLPIIGKELPAASEASSEYWDQLLEAAAVYDQSIARAIQQAVAEAWQALAPARIVYTAGLQAALQADAAATEQQQQKIVDLLGAALLGFAAGYSAPAVHPPVFVSCTPAGCLAQ
jgi:hypothetical protein